MRAIADLPGIGPKTAAWLEAVDIATEAELREIGAVDAYRRLKHRDPPPEVRGQRRRQCRKTATGRESLAI